MAIDTTKIKIKIEKNKDENDVERNKEIETVLKDEYNKLKEDRDNYIEIVKKLELEKNVNNDELLYYKEQIKITKWKWKNAKVN